MKWKKQNKEQDELEKKMEATPRDVTKEFHEFLRYVHDLPKQGLSSGEVRSKMSERLNQLSDTAYVTYFPEVVYIIQRSKDKCAGFKNTQEQVKNILSWLPRLKDHEELLTLYIKERRKKYKLEV